ncbi:hypothetical protein NGRA_0362 [Nosema granulosis]|uniref:Uncharacterized protein n=1 Tax=Nosema granulosis TaxID=83296 RepID=A0A9P6H125_9MICR|nr:hypothetical protein NGRA_0362 [Nosema granulosis]
MTIIRLPLSLTNYTEDDEDVENVEYKKYTKQFINNTFKEIKDTIGSYHSIKEIECRRKLAVFFKQKVCDFELFDLFSSGVRHLKQVKIQNRSIKDIDKQNIVYEDLANHIAEVFESLKQVIPPSFDVKTALQSLIDYRYLLPDFYEVQTPVDVGFIDFSHINRLCKIYLAKENLLAYDNVNIVDGTVYLTINDLQLEIVLCGDLSSPRWQLLDIKEKDGTKDNTNETLRIANLRTEFIKTVKNVFTDFNFSKMAKMLEIYESHCLVYSIYERFKIAKKHCDLSIDGGYKRYTVTIDQYRLNFEISKDGSTVLCEIATFKKITKFSTEILQNIEKTISESLPKNTFFTLESGFIYSESPSEATSKIVNITEHNKISNSLKDLSEEELRTTKFSFRTRGMLLRFIEHAIKEKFFYRKIFFAMEKYALIRDHRSFGEHNVVIKDNRRSIVISLVSQGKETFTVNLQNLCELVDGVTQVHHLKIDNGTLCFGSGNSQIDMIEGIEFIKRNIDILLTINRFYSFKEHFKLTDCIQIQDIEIKNVQNGYILKSNDRTVNVSSIDQILNHLVFFNLLDKLKSISQLSHPTSNLYLFKENTRLADMKDQLIAPFENLISFYVKKDLWFIEFHFKNFNITLSSSLEVSSTNVLLSEMFHSVKSDLYDFLKFLDRAHHFFSKNLRPTICTTTKLFYNFPTLKDFCVIRLIENGYLIQTNSKNLSSSDPNFNLEATVSEIKQCYNEDRYIKIVAICKDLYETTITGSYTECKTAYIKFTVDSEIALKITENASLVETTHMESFLNTRLLISDGFEYLKVFNDISKINNLFKTNKNC